MTVLLFKPIRNRISENLQRAVEEATSEGRVEISISIQGLLKGVRQLSYGEGVAVLLVSSREDLDDVLSIKEQLRDVRIILILPDKEDETVSRGHTLYPRYLSYVDSGFEDVKAVLRKMINGPDQGTVKGESVHPLET